jgi:hypothetical protein
LASGRPQHVIAEEFLAEEIFELMAYEDMEWKQNDKQDFRHASLIAHIRSANGQDKVNVADYLMSWDLSAQAAEEYDADVSEGIWMGF